MKQIIASLDIGSNSIKLIVSEFYKTKLFVLSCVEVKSNGIKKGLIVDPEVAFQSIKKAIDKTEDVISIPIKKVVVSVPSFFTELVNTTASVSIMSEDKIIRGKDVKDVQKRCIVDIPSNKELINIVPINYILDDDKIVTNPKGCVSATLEINASLVLVPKKNIYPIVSILDSLNVDIIDFCVGGIADYYEFKDSVYDESNTAVVNIGKDKTEVSLFEKGVLNSSCIIELGSRNIDRDISYICGTSIQESCKIKEEFALANTRNASTSETRDCLTREGENIKINQYEVSEVIASRVDEILDLIKSQINILTKKEINYIIVTGGCTELKDFEISLDHTFGKKSKKMSIHELGARNNKFSTCLGLSKYYIAKLCSRDDYVTFFEEEEENKMFIDKDNGTGGILKKVYGYFFDD